MRIGYYSYYPNPWYGLARKMFEHHHHIFRMINEKHELQITLMVKPQNRSKIKKYLAGETSLLVEGFRKIPFEFPEDDDLSYMNSLDALFLEPGRVFLMDEVFGSKNERIDNAREQLIQKIQIAMIRKIPILWYDGDADLMTDSDKNFASWLFRKLNMNQYAKCTVIGPYEDCKDKINNFKFVPYNIDFETLPKYEDLKGAEEREIVSTYFGSNYHRDSFIPHFNKVSELGRMVVYGSSWNQKKIPNVELNKAIWLPEDGFVPYYDKSLFGLYGDNDLTGDYKHYTLRIAEYLKAGIYIIPDFKDYLIDKFEDNCKCITIEDDLGSFMEYLKADYVEMVCRQRDILKKTFDSANYVPIYSEALGVI